MHATERESLILEQIAARGFLSFRDMEKLVDASPATIRRDLDRMEQECKLQRVHGGAKSLELETKSALPIHGGLAGAPFSANMKLNVAEKMAIARMAATLCTPGEGIMIDGGTTTFLMCPHLKGLNLQVLTNSLHIVWELINQKGTRVLVPSGTVFPEQGIILSAFGEDGMPKFHAPKLFMGAGALGPQGLMQQDVILVAAERRLIERAQEVIVLADATKFDLSSGNVVCDLERIDTIVTDDRVTDKAASMIERAGARLLVADR